jgi:hypothetical protein
MQDGAACGGDDYYTTGCVVKLAFGTFRTSSALARYTRFMHLGVARLCLDCHEIHEYDRCPACTSEAFAYITRWIKLDNVPSRPPIEHENSSAGEKIDTYRQILQPTASGSRITKWLRNGSLLLAAGYLARWGWHIRSRHTNDPNAEKQKSSGT